MEQEDERLDVLYSKIERISQQKTIVAPLLYVREFGDTSKWTNHMETVAEIMQGRVSACEAELEADELETLIEELEKAL